MGTPLLLQFNSTPLIRTQSESVCLSGFFEWLLTNPLGVDLCDFECISADGLLHPQIHDFLEKNQFASCVNLRKRAILRPSLDGKSYLQATLPAKRQKEYKRREKRFSELGNLECVSLENRLSADECSQAFLTLEASGWKGSQGTALDCKESERLFFQEIVHEAFSRKRLMMPALLMDGKPVAMECNFLALPGAFGFKKAFDENFFKIFSGCPLSHSQHPLLARHAGTSMDGLLLGKESVHD